MCSATMLRRIGIALSAVLSIILATEAQAQGRIPRTLSYQGVLLDSTGIAVCDSTWDIAFSIYRTSTGGSFIWTEQHNVRTKLGVFGVVLGQKTPLAIQHGDSLWLEIQVGAAEPVASRVQLTAVPYALSADTATHAFVATSAHMLSPEGADALRKSIGLPENNMGNILIGAINETGTASIDPHRLPNAGTKSGSDVHAYGRIDSMQLMLGKGVVGPDELEDVFTTLPTGLGGPTQTLVIQVDLDGRVRSIAAVEITGVTPGGDAGGDLIGTYPAPLVRDSAITRTKLRNASVSTEKLINESVTHEKLADFSVDTDNIVDRAVTTPKLADSAVTTPKLANGSVTTEKLARYSVTADKILDHQVSSDKMTSMPLTPGTYGNSTQVAQVYVDEAGRIVTVRNVDVVSVPPAGPAGGDLTGVYPNPQIRDSAVTHAKVATNAITSSKIQDGEVRTADLATDAVTTSKIANEQVTTEKMKPTGVIPGVYGGQQYTTIFSVDTSGRVTSATTVPITGVSPTGVAGGDLTGTYPNPSVAPSAITSSKIADGTIATADIANNAVTTAKMSTTGVTTGSYGSATQVPAFTVDASGRLTAAGNVTITGTTPGGTAGGDLTGTYPNPSVAPSAITTAKLANDAVTSSKIDDGTIATVDVADNAITSSKMSNTGVAAGLYGTATQVPAFIVDGAGRVTSAANVTITGTTPGGAAGGDLSGTYPNPSVAPLAITTPKIADGAVTATKLAATAVAPGTYGTGLSVSQITVDAQGRITAAQEVVILGAAPTGVAGGDLTGNFPNPTIANSAVTSAKIGDGEVATADIATGAVTSAKIGDGEVATADIATGAVTSAKIGDGEVATADIADGAITTAKIADGAITSSKLANTAVTAATYGSATQVGQFTVDAQGRITSATNVTITGGSPTGAAGGDLNGTYPNPTVDGLQGRTVSSAAPSNGNLLTWSAAGSQWEPSALTIGGKAVSSSTPTDGHSLMYDAATNQWVSGSATASIKKFILTEGDVINVDNLRGAATVINNVVISDHAFFRLVTAGANFDITGFTGGENGRMIIIMNTTNKNVVFQDEDTRSTAANRLRLGVANKTINPEQAATFMYSTSLSRWVLISTT